MNLRKGTHDGPRVCDQVYPNSPGILLGVRLMRISDGGVIVQNGVETSLVVEVKEKKDNDPILLELNGVIHH